MVELWTRGSKLVDVEEEVEGLGAHPLVKYTVQTELLGIIAALPLCCREKIFSHQGFAAQLALLALMENEKFAKKYKKVKRANFSNKLILKNLLKKFAKRILEKIFKKVLRSRLLKKKYKVLTRFMATRRGLKAKSKLKLKSKRKSPAKKKSKIKLKLIKAKRSFNKVKRGSKVKSSVRKTSKRVKVSKTKTTGLKKLMGSPKKVTIQGKAKKISQKVPSKSKLFNMEKPKAKDIDKLKRSIIKKMKARERISLLQTKKKLQAGHDREQKQKSLRFFQQSRQSQSANSNIKLSKTAK